jgi:hypothetical protein
VWHASHTVLLGRVEDMESSGSTFIDRLFHQFDHGGSDLRVSNQSKSEVLVGRNLVGLLAVDADKLNIAVEELAMFSTDSLCGGTYKTRSELAGIRPGKPLQRN